MNDRRKDSIPPRSHLLFADSGRVTRELACRILGEEFEVSIAMDIDQAWRALVEDPAIKVLFLGIEDQKGVVELVKRVRASDDLRIRETPIVQVTDSDLDDDSRQVALAAGVTDFIDKPFQPSVLLARARSISAHSAGRQRLAEQHHGHSLDSETGLGNRRYFFERLGQTLSFGRRSGQSTSLLHVHFEGLTDNLKRLGSHFRQKRMTKVGHVLSSAVRREGTAYRTGPEHFCFILPGTDPTGARVVCQRLEPLLDGIGMLRGDGILAVVGHLTIQHLELGNDRSVEDCLREVREGLAPMIAGSFKS